MRKLALFMIGLLGLAGCGSSNDSSQPPPDPSRQASVALALSGSSGVEESDNPKVRLTLVLDAPATGPVSVALNLGGSATRDRDYAISDDKIQFPAGATSASAEIDVYRDFDEEGDETIEVDLGAITGNARAGDQSSITLNVIDGPAASVDKSPPDNADSEGESPLVLEPLGFDVEEDAMVALVVAGVPPNTPAAPMVTEWSTDPTFTSGVTAIRECYGPSENPSADRFGPPMNPCEATPDPLDSLFFHNLRLFRLPLDALAPDGHYFLRIRLGTTPTSFEWGREYPNVVTNSFATDSEGTVLVRCRAPERTPAPGGGDPLFEQQWHLENTGQKAFAEQGGTPGADLNMKKAIDAGHKGAGVKLAVVDSGLEICHPDLAANTAEGGSFNFGAGTRPGASSDDPYNFASTGDHGTSVAGVAAAAADNGFGGRGVAPAVTLVGFNPLEAAPDESGDSDMAAEIALLKSLGTSASEPDSASVDVFNMSFGLDEGIANADEEFTRAFRMGVEKLRSGRGAVYVKAAGNAFELCEQRIHPLQKEIGCTGANSDPDQNTPWMVVVGGFNADDEKSTYSSAGANLWIAGPSGQNGITAPAMITTDQAGPFAGYSILPENRLTSDNPLNRDGDYINSFGGTSSAAPAVSGAVAILLGISPELTWRDIKHILASTARKIDPDIAEVRAAFKGTPYILQHAWQTNAAGFDFHNWYGFGAADVDAAVAMAESHTPDSLGTLVESEWFEAGRLSTRIPDADGAGISAAMEVSGLPEDADIEAVVLEIAVEGGDAFDLGITLRSPAGTQSVLNTPLNSLLEGSPGISDWHLLSNAFYGENPNGTWTLHVADIVAADTGTLTDWKLRFYHGKHGAN
ncbi:MAG: S8 family serine peptidase [Candidatus Dadabacteria bacterium]|nr:S8 family serine peptidase [Candidatus Dadabacteria bacterium]MYB25913.1 S8 family serine peptidase [Candidatus Dadabacteria bacterium]